jgi:hypothetical protein
MSTTKLAQLPFPVSYEYLFGDVWRTEHYWNGNRAKDSRGLYTEEQMRDYALAAVAQAEAKPAEPLPMREPTPAEMVAMLMPVYGEGYNAGLAAAPAAPALTGHVLVPLEVLIEASRAIGHFVSDEGWADEDMQAMDNLDFYIAQHVAIAASKGENNGQ